MESLDLNIKTRTGIGEQEKEVKRKLAAATRDVEVTYPEPSTAAALHQGSVVLGDVRLFCRQNLDYESAQLIENSEFGKTYLINHAVLGACSVKRFHLPTPASIAWSELKALKSLQSSYVLPCFGAFFDGSLTIVMAEYAGTLAEVRGPCAEAIIAKVAVEIGEALYFIHEKGWLHCDVQPANIVFFRCRFVLKGFAKSSHMNSSRTAFGDPEASSIYFLDLGALQNAAFTFKTDMFGFMCCLYMMEKQRHPFQQDDTGALLSIRHLIRILSNGFTSVNGEIIPVDTVLHRCRFRDLLKLLLDGITAKQFVSCLEFKQCRAAQDTGAAITWCRHSVNDPARIDPDQEAQESQRDILNHLIKAKFYYEREDLIASMEFGPELSRNSANLLQFEDDGTRIEELINQRPSNINDILGQALKNPEPGPLVNQVDNLLPDRSQADAADGYVFLCLTCRSFCSPVAKYIRAHSRICSLTAKRFIKA